MRKIIESTLVSLDGVIGDPHLWAMQYFDHEAQQEALEGLLASGAMLMGRRTYEGEKSTLKLVGTKTRGNGVVVLTYQPVKMRISNQAH
jgi:dihydrofolate reductase